MLHTKAYGTANMPCVVFLHGFLGSSDDWHDIAVALSAHYYCLCLDLPAHGQSEALEQGGNGFAAFNAQLHATLKAQQISEYVLVAYSLGGRLAMYHASLQPQGLKGLILESCHSGLACENEREARRAHDASWAQRFRTQALREVLKDWYCQGVFRALSHAQREQLIALRAQQNSVQLANMLEATSLGRQANLRPLLAKLTLPITLITGEHDTKFCQLAQHLFTQLTNCNWTIINDAGHNCHFEQPQGFYQQLLHSLHHVVEAS